VPAQKIVAQKYHRNHARTTPFPTHVQDLCYCDWNIMSTGMYGPLSKPLSLCEIPSSSPAIDATLTAAELLLIAVQFDSGPASHVTFWRLDQPRLLEAPPTASSPAAPKASSSSASTPWSTSPSCPCTSICFLPRLILRLRRIIDE